MTSHYLNDGNGRYTVNRAVAGYLAHSNSNVLGCRTEAGSVVGDTKIVVDSFRYADDLDIKTVLGKVFGELVDCIHGIVAAYVEESPYLTLFERIYDLLVDRVVILPVRELISARTEHGGWSLTQKIHIIVCQYHRLHINKVI